MTKAFTLVEVILVMLVLGVIAALAVPNFGSSYKNLQLNQAVDQFAYLMRYAQSRAIAKGDVVRLEIDLSAGSYWLTEKENPIQGRYGKHKRLSLGFKVEVDEGHVVDFYPDGQIEKQNIIICFHEKCKTISTQIQRGVVHILDGQV